MCQKVISKLTETIPNTIKSVVYFMYMWKIQKREKKEKEHMKIDIKNLS